MAAVRLLPPKLQASLGLTSKGSSSHRSGVEANRQLTGKFILQATRVANRSVDLVIQPNKTRNSSALTPSLASPKPLAPTSGPAEVPQLDPAPRAPIHGPALRAPTSPSPVRPTPAPLLRPAHSAPASLPLPAPSPNNVTFGPGIAEALPYATTAQAPYPPPIDSPTDDLAATAKATTREILEAPSLLSFLASKKSNTLVVLTEGVAHPVAFLLQSYVEEGILSHTGPPWYLHTLKTAISKGPHALTCTPDMTAFIQGEM